MTTTRTHKAESSKTTHTSTQPFFQKKKEGNNTAVSNAQKDIDTRKVAGESRADEVKTNFSIEQFPVNDTSEDLDIIKVDESITTDFPQQEQVQQEEVAKVEKLATTGNSDEVALAFTEASPSQMAVSYGDMGGEISQKFSAEQSETQTEAPTLKATMSGKVEEGITPPDKLATATKATIKEQNFREPPIPKIKAHENKSEIPDNKAAKTVLKDLPEEDFGNHAKENFPDILNNISVSDKGINTSAGARPKVNTSGEANVHRSDNLQNQSKNQLQKESNTVETAFKNHPGQQNIQAKHIDEPFTAQLTNKTKEVLTQEHQALKDYSEAALPTDVRAQADSMLAPALQEKMAKAKTDVGTAANQRDTEKQKKYTEAENKAAELNKTAETEQRRIVIDNRKKVAEQQQAGIRESREQIKKFDTEASGKKKTLQSDINTKIQTAEKQADAALKKGEEKALEKKKESEKEAEKKKQELTKKAENQGFFSRVASAIQSAINSIVDAINTIFDALRKAVKIVIEAAKQLAIKTVEAARKWVVDKLNAFRDWAKKKVNALLKNFPAIAKRINKLIDAAVNIAIKGVNKVAEGLKKGIEKLANFLAVALDKILFVFQTALTTAVQIVGAMLTGDMKGALRVGIIAACKIAGVDANIIFDFLDKAKNTVTDILKNPVRFFNFLVTGIGTGVRNFGKNIKKHLMGGLVGWLTGTLASAGVEIPQKFNAIGIFKLLASIVGATYQNVKNKIIKRYPPAEKVFDTIETTFGILSDFRARGSIVLWEKINDKFTDLKATVIGGIRDIFIVKVVKSALSWLLSFVNPAAAIVKVVKLLYNLVMFLIERFQQIKDFVLSIYNTLAAIASGNLSKLIKGVESALVGSIPVFMSLIAAVLDIGGVVTGVKKIITKVSKPIHKFINALIERVVAWVKKFIKGGKKVVKKIKDKIVAWWKARKEFKTQDGEEHSLFFKGSGKNAALMVASDETKYSYFIKNIAVNSKEKKDIRDEAEIIAKEIDALKNAPVGAATIKETEENRKRKKKKIEGKLEELSALTVQLFGLKNTDELPDSKVEYPEKLDAEETKMGKKMVATILTRKPVKDAKHKGSPPTQAKHPIYDKLNLRRKGGVSYYVRGHLLNDNIHGPGQWYNMVPLSRKGNANHSTPSEYIVKNSTLSGAVISYSVEAVYDREKNDSVKDREKLEETNFDKEKIEDILTIREFERYVPTHLTLNAALLGLDEKGKFTVKLKNLLPPDKKVVNEVDDEDVTKYETGRGEPKKVVSLLNSSVEEIVENARLDRDYAINIQEVAQDLHRIKKEEGELIRKYQDIADHIENFALKEQKKWTNFHIDSLKELLKKMEKTKDNIKNKDRIKNIKIYGKTED